MRGLSSGSLQGGEGPAGHCVEKLLCQGEEKRAGLLGVLLPENSFPKNVRMRARNQRIWEEKGRPSAGAQTLLFLPPEDSQRVSSKIQDRP